MNSTLTETINFAIITSQFNRDVTDKLYQGALQHLQACGIRDEQIQSYWVPGAVEIPVTAKIIAEQKLSSVIICLGAVIRGETGHYDFVCQQVSFGCQKVALKYSIPVIFGVLTTDNKTLALARAGGSHSDGGRDAAIAAIHMAELVAELRAIASTKMV